MSIRRFTEKEIKELLQNPNVERCSEKSITYSKSFKIAAIEEYQKGLPPLEIFRQAKFNIDLIGRETPEKRLGNWRKVFKEKGIQALSVETRGKGKGGGRPKRKRVKTTAVRKIRNHQNIKQRNQTTL